MAGILQIQPLWAAKDAAVGTGSGEGSGRPRAGLVTKDPIMRARTRAMALFTGLALAGCEGGNLAQVLAPGSGELQVTVSEGVAPTYSWSGETARSLLVRSSSGEVFWEIEAVDPLEGFAAPVRHGQTPAGARVVVPSRLLQTSVVHTATVVGVGGGRGDVTFTPSPLTTP